MKRRHRVSDVCGGRVQGSSGGGVTVTEGAALFCRRPCNVGVIYGITDTAAAVDGQNITVSVGVARREKRRSGSLALLRGAIKSAQQCRPPCRLPW